MKVSTYLLAISLLLIGADLMAQRGLMVAHRQYELGNYTDAVTKYREILNEDPENKEVILRLADALRELRQLEEAAELYGKIARMDEPAREFLFKYGKTLMELEKYKDAKQWFLKYAEIDPVKGLHYALSCDFAIANQEKAGRASIEPMPFNSTHNESNPVFQNGRLIFTTDKPDNGMHIGYDGNIWYSTDKVDKEILEESDVRQLAYCESSQTIALARGVYNPDLRPASSVRQSIALYLAEASDDGHWQHIKPFPYNISGYTTAYPAFSPDGTRLYFASDRPGGYGGYDLYYCDWKEGNWTYPINLGKEINTQGNEISPFITETGLYFASDFHPGFGGLDIFYSRKMDWDWADPENLGYGINTGLDDYQYVVHPDGQQVAWASNRIAGKGGGDIFLTTYSPEEIPEFSDEKIIAAKQPGQFMDAAMQFAPGGDPEKSHGKAEFTSLAAENEETTLKLLPNKEWSYKVLQDPEHKAYFIQVVALSRYKSELERFRDLNQYGNVYAYTADGITRIRIGMFPHVRDAVQVLNKLKRQNYRDAYIIHDKPNESKMELIATAASDAFRPNYDNAGSGDVEPTSKYKIRLAAYSRNTQFDTGAVWDLGTIEQWTKGSWKIITIGGFSDLSETKRVLAEVKKRGFKDAYIVLDNDGFLEPIED